MPIGGRMGGPSHNAHYFPKKEGNYDMLQQGHPRGNYAHELGEAQKNTDHKIPPTQGP